MITFLLFIIALPILLRIAVVGLAGAACLTDWPEDHPWIGLIPVVVIWGGAILCNHMGWLKP